MYIQIKTVVFISSPLERWKDTQDSPIFSKSNKRRLDFDSVLNYPVRFENICHLALKILSLMLRNISLKRNLVSTFILFLSLVLKQIQIPINISFINDFKNTSDQKL